MLTGATSEPVRARANPNATPINPTCARSHPSVLAAVDDGEEYGRDDDGSALAEAGGGEAGEEEAAEQHFLAHRRTDRNRRPEQRHVAGGRVTRNDELRRRATQDVVQDGQADREQRGGHHPAGEGTDPDATDGEVLRQRGALAGPGQEAAGEQHDRAAEQGGERQVHPGQGRFLQGLWGRPGRRPRQHPRHQGHPLGGRIRDEDHEAEQQRHPGAPRPLHPTRPRPWRLPGHGCDAGTPPPRSARVTSASVGRMRSASASFAGGNVWATATQRMPAARAAWTPLTASSMTVQVPGSSPSFPRRRQKDVRGRLLVDDVLRRHHRVPPGRRQADAVQIGLDLDQIGARSHREAQSGAAEFAGLRHRSREGREPGRHEREVDLVGAPLGLLEVEPHPVLLGDAAEITVLAGPDERQEILRGHRHAAFAKHRHGGVVDQRFGVGENTVHVEDDRPEVHAGAHPKAGRRERQGRRRVRTPRRAGR
jgi:hypothetical protein